MLKAIWDALNAVVAVLWFLFNAATKFTMIWTIRRKSAERGDILAGKVIDPALVEKYAKFKKDDVSR